MPSQGDRARPGGIDWEIERVSRDLIASMAAASSVSAFEIVELMAVHTKSAMTNQGIPPWMPEKDRSGELPIGSAQRERPPAACGGPKALARTWSKFGDHDRFRASDSEPASQGRTDEVVLYVLTAALRDVQMGRERAAYREGEPADGGSEPDVEWAGEQLVHARVAGALLEQVEA